MKLYVDGQFCPLDKSLVLPTLFNLEGVTNPQSAVSGREIELEIPSTAASDAIFGVARDIYGTTRFNDSHHTARIECSGVVVFEGTIYILNCTMGCRHGGSYRVRIVSGGADWAKRAATTTLQNSGLEFEMTLTPENIKSTWTGFQPVRFLPVLRNRYSAHYSGLSGAPLEYIMTTDDYHPFFSAAALFENIFEGYDVEGKFFLSSLLRQLYFSGQYASPDTVKQQALLDFCARRQAPATAFADEDGRVYATVSFQGDSALGNIVDTANPTAVDCDGKLMQDTFTTGNVFSINEQGYCQFESSMAASVGFILHLEYATDYRIASRTALTGFNRVIAEPDVDVTFTLANPFEDKREKLVSGLTYNLCIFDYIPGLIYQFTIFDAESGAEVSRQTVDSRFLRVTMPSGITPRCTLETMLGEKVEVESDWALYLGYVEECGTTEVALDVRIPPQQFAPQQKMQFNRIKFGGAEPGMEITLSTACSLRPYFSTVPGYGSTVTLADISHSKIWLIDVVDAICKMFNLVIFTDEQNRRVYIDQLEDFYTKKVWDWSDKIDFSSQIRLSDMGVDVAHILEWRYRTGDYASEQYNIDNNTELGCWRFNNPTYGAKQSQKSVVNPLFTTGVNKCGQYALAPSASIMQVGDSSAEGSMDAPFTTHVVRYAGLSPLPEGERWGYPLNENRYPLAAFFFGGDELNDGFSLCYEDRDGIEGLNRFFDEMTTRVATRQRLKLSLRLSAMELVQLLSVEGNWPTIRDTFRLNILGESSLYRLESLLDYNPDTGLATCTFIRLTKD